MCGHSSISTVWTAHRLVERPALIPKAKPLTFGANRESENPLFPYPPGTLVQPDKLTVLEMAFGRVFCRPITSEDKHSEHPQTPGGCS